MELCRVHGIRNVTLYAWWRKFGRVAEAAVELWPPPGQSRVPLRLAHSPR